MMHDLVGFEFWIGFFAGMIAIGGFFWAVARKVVFPWIRRRLELVDLQDPHQPVLGDVLSWPNVRAGLDRLVQDATEFKPTMVVGINRGGSIVGGIIAKRLALPRVYLIDVRSGPEAQVVFQNGVGEPDYTRVLLVDDSVRSGDHLSAATDYLKGCCSVRKQEIRRAVLLDVHVRRVSPEARPRPQVEFSAFHSQNGNIKIAWDT